MSVLEFIVAIKWPVTILIMTGIILLVLRWSAGTRQAIRIWMDRRNLRVHVAGQEIEATLVQTQGSMDLAAGNDSTLADTVAIGEDSPEAAEQESQLAPEAVELLRRAAVENVVNGAVRLGWQWSQRGGAEPDVTVSWTDDGHPRVSFEPAVATTSTDTAGDLMRLRTEGITSEADARVAVRIMLNALYRHAGETSAQQDAMWAAIRRRMRRNRGGENAELRITDTHSG